MQGFYVLRPTSSRLVDHKYVTALNFFPIAHILIEGHCLELRLIHEHDLHVRSFLQKEAGSWKRRAIVIGKVGLPREVNNRVTLLTSASTVDTQFDLRGLVGCVIACSTIW